MHRITGADDAHTQAVAADRQAAADKAAADKKAAAAKAAADKKAEADRKAAADKKAFEDAAKAASEKNTIDSDGVREVGVDINPGRWKTAVGGSCYYAILNSSDTFDIADNNNVDGPATVDLAPGKFFETQNCGTWTRTG